MGLLSSFFCGYPLGRVNSRQRWLSKGRMGGEGSYEKAVDVLAEIIRVKGCGKIVTKEERGTCHPRDKLRSSSRLLEKSGMRLEDLDSIKIIHVTGTKGKGSTCAMIESVLRKSGYKTGFFSSPHLVSMRERIRIDGTPVSKEVFARHFWEVYGAVKSVEEKDDPITYFKFFTVLAFNIFWKESVDVAVVEVGIGGAYDCTNIIRKPIACAITSLGLDHTNILGDTIQDIAWNKAGIVKPGAPVFVDAYQPSEGMRVIEKISSEQNSPCYVVPEFGRYDWGPYPRILGLQGPVQFQNASVALQVSRYFLSLQNGREFSPGCPFQLSSDEALGLRTCSWPGRFQVINRGPSLTFYLDSAHTKESVEACSTWYENNQSSGEKVTRVLIYNAIKSHDSASMLKILKARHSFDLVIFCTNIVTGSNKISENSYPPKVAMCMEDRCRTHSEIWKEDGPTTEKVVIIPYVSHALLWATNGRDKILNEKYGNEKIRFLDSKDLDFIYNDNIEILVTGSLHLVGDVIGALDVDLQDLTGENNNEIKV